MSVHAPTVAAMDDDRLAARAEESLASLLAGKTLVPGEDNDAPVEVSAIKTFAERGWRAGGNGLVLKLSDGSRVQLAITAHAAGDPDAARARQRFEAVAAEADPEKVARMMAHIDVQFARLPESHRRRLQ
jgi:hypothetical protein